jgi:hypothetical protein
LLIIFGTFDGLFVRCMQNAKLPNDLSFFDLRNNSKRLIPAGNGQSLFVKKVGEHFLLSIAWPAKDKFDRDGFIAYGKYLKDLHKEPDLKSVFEKTLKELLELISTNKLTEKGKVTGLPPTDINRSIDLSHLPQNSPAKNHFLYKYNWKSDFVVDTLARNLDTALITLDAFEFALNTETGSDLHSFPPDLRAAMDGEQVGVLTLVKSVQPTRAREQIKPLKQELNEKPDRLKPILHINEEDLSNASIASVGKIVFYWVVGLGVLTALIVWGITALMSDWVTSAVIDQKAQLVAEVVETPDNHQNYVEFRWLMRMVDSAPSCYNRSDNLDLNEKQLYFVDFVSDKIGPLPASCSHLVNSFRLEAKDFKESNVSKSIVWPVKNDPDALAELVNKHSGNKIFLSDTWSLQEIFSKLSEPDKWNFALLPPVNQKYHYYCNSEVVKAFSKKQIPNNPFLLFIASTTPEMRPTWELAALYSYFQDRYLSYLSHSFEIADTDKQQKIYPRITDIDRQFKVEGKGFDTLLLKGVLPKEYWDKTYERSDASTFEYAVNQCILSRSEINSSFEKIDFDKFNRLWETGNRTKYPQFINEFPEKIAFWKSDSKDGPNIFRLERKELPGSPTNELLSEPMFQYKIGRKLNLNEINVARLIFGK